MAITTGTATDYHDLLDDLRTWLTGTVGWTQEAYTAPGSISDPALLYLRGPGAGEGSRVYVNIETEADVGNGTYSWAIYGATGYDSGLAAASQPGAGGPVYFNLWEQSLDYWFYANDRRMIVVAQAGTNYLSMYAGFVLPFALPSEYPHPLYIAGNYRQPALPSEPNNSNSSIADPGESAAMYRRRTSGVWQAVTNQLISAQAPSPATGERAFIWPQGVGRRSISATTTNPEQWSHGGFNTMRDNFEGETPLIQSHLVDMQDRTIVGALDGVFGVSGFGRTAEQTITVGATTYRLFPRIFRSTAGDFMAIAEV